MEEIETLTDYFYYLFPKIKDNIKNTIEIDTYTLYIEFDDSREFVWEAGSDDLINITNSEDLPEYKKRLRFRIIMAKYMKRWKLTTLMVGRRIGRSARTVYTYLKGDVFPDKYIRKEIARAISCDIEELYIEEPEDFM